MPAMTRRLIWTLGCLGVMLVGLSWEAAHAQDTDLAKKLANPIASLISIPIQANYDQRIGPQNDGNKTYFNVQPVIPISLDANWNVISRTIIPVVSQDDIVPGAGHQSGLGDVSQSLFFSPKAAGPSGIIWGVGPMLVLPTATDQLLGGDKWAAGPTGVMLKQSGAWTYGVLANHVWSFAGDSARNNISSTYIQPFLAYTTADAWTYALNLESSYNWEVETWSVPVNATVSKLLRFGHQPVQIGGGLRYWLASPDSGPKGLGARMSVTFLFPAK